MKWLRRSRTRFYWTTNRAAPQSMTADCVASVIAGVALLVSLYSIYKQRASAKPNWGSNSVVSAVSTRGLSSGVPKFVNSARVTPNAFRFTRALGIGRGASGKAGCRTSLRTEPSPCPARSPQCTRTVSQIGTTGALCAAVSTHGSKKRSPTTVTVTWCRCESIGFNRQIRIGSGPTSRRARSRSEASPRGQSCLTPARDTPSEV